MGDVRGGAAGAAMGQQRAGRSVWPRSLLWVVDAETPGVAARARPLGGGVRVSLCRDPLEALARLRDSRGTHHALLTDLHLPGMDGITLGLEARCIQPELPIGLCSPWPDERIERLVRLHAFDVWIHESSGSSAWLRQIDELLDRSPGLADDLGFFC